MSQLSRRQLLAVPAGPPPSRSPAAAATAASKDDLSGNKDGAMDNTASATSSRPPSRSRSPSCSYSNPGYPHKADWLFCTELAKRTNVKLDPTVVPLSDYNQKRSVLIGARRRPADHPEDLPPGRGAVHRLRRHPAGQRLRRPDAELQGQGRQVEPAAAIWTACGRRTASSTCCPGCTRKVWQDYTLAVRTDVLKKLNTPVPEHVGRRVHHAQDDEGGLPGPVPVLRPVEHTAQPGRQRPAEHPRPRRTAPTRGWDYQAHTLGRQRQEVRLHRRHGRVPADRCSTSTSWSTERLLDPESFTQTDDQARQKFATGKSFVISGNAQTWSTTYRPDLAKVIPARDGHEDPAADRAGRPGQLQAQPAGERHHDLVEGPGRARTSSR